MLQIRINREHIIGVICIALGTTVLVLTRSFPSGQGNVQLTGPAFFPNVLAIVLMIVGVTEIVLGFVRTSALPAVSTVTIGTSIRDRGTQTIFIVIGSMVAYGFLMKPIGFYVTSFAFLFGNMWRLGVRWWKSLVYSLVLLVVLFLVFERLFYVNLPRGILV